MLRCLCSRFAAVVLPDGPEEGFVREVAVVVDVASAGVLVEAGQALFQPLVRVVLVDHVGLEDGVEAPLVARVVVAFAAAAHGVLDPLVVLLGLDEVA